MICRTCPGGGGDSFFAFKKRIGPMKIRRRVFQCFSLAALMLSQAPGQLSAMASPTGNLARSGSAGAGASGAASAAESASLGSPVSLSERGMDGFIDDLMSRMTLEEKI